MAKKIHLSIMTPASKLYDKEVDSVLLRSTEGEMVILPGHTALTCGLDYGVMKIVVDGEELKATVMAGFVEVTPKKITILTDAAEWPEDIDPERAKASRERAIKRLASGEDIDTERANLAIRRSKLRIEASGFKPRDRGF